MQELLGSLRGAWGALLGRCGTEAYATVAAYCAAVLLLSRIFGVAYPIGFIVVALPFALACWDTPLSPYLDLCSPLPLLITGCVLLITLGLGLFLGRLLIGGGGSAKGSRGGIWLLCLMLLIVSYCYYRPDLSAYVPQRTVTLFLASFCLFACSLSLFRFLRAGAVLVAWTALLMLTGGELLLKSVPDSMWRPAAGYLQEQLNSSLKRHITWMTKAEGDSNYRVVVLGGASAYGYPLPAEKRYSALLAQHFAANDNAKIEVLSLSGTKYKLRDLERVFQKEVLPLKPNAVLVSGWYADAADLPGWLSDYRETMDQDSPGLYSAAILSARETRLFQLASAIISGVSIDDRIKEPDKRRAKLSAAQFERNLDSLIGKIKASGIQPLLLFEPAGPNAPMRGQYRQIHERIAQRYAIPFIDGEAVLNRKSDDITLLSEHLLTERGHQLIARAIARVLDSVIVRAERTA